MTSRRRVEHSYALHHWCQDRSLLALVPRRSFRADTRRGFAPASTWICIQCGLEADDPHMLCEPRRKDAATASTAVLGEESTGRAFPTPLHSQ